MDTHVSTREDRSKWKTFVLTLLSKQWLISSVLQICTSHWYAQRDFGLILWNQNIFPLFPSKNNLYLLASLPSSYLSMLTSVTRLWKCLQVTDRESPSVSLSKVRLSYNTWVLVQIPFQTAWICSLNLSCFTFGQTLWMQTGKQLQGDRWCCKDLSLRFGGRNWRERMWQGRTCTPFSSSLLLHL